MATSAFLDSSPSNSEAADLPRGLSQAEINVICEAMSSSFYKKSQETLRQLADAAVGHDTVYEDKSQATSLILTAPTASKATSPTVTRRYVACATSPITSIAEEIERKVFREFAASPVPGIFVEDDSTQTSIRQNIADMATDPCTSQLVNRSTVTTPVGREDVETETSRSEQVQRDQNTSPIADDKDDRSMQTSISEWFGKLLKKKDESQQTSLCEDIGKKKKSKKKKTSRDESLGSDVLTSSSQSTSESGASREHGSHKDKSKKTPAIMSESVSMSTQYSPPPCTDRLSEPNRARSWSTSGMGASIFEEESRQEVIVQTDDSYLKIARRLDEYRNNKTQFLPVCAAAPLSSKEVEPFKSDRPSERSHYYFGGRRGSGGRGRKKSRQEMSHRESQTGQSMDAELLTEVLNEEESPPRNGELSTMS
uniref:Uncharacterized protein n=1 Tax=Caenorhabditis japonica TaxID=281687 RepID=A0A8R1ENH7_CAEJA